MVGWFAGWRSRAARRPLRFPSICQSCGLRPADDGSLLAGHVDSGHSRRLLRDTGRTSVTRDQLLYDRTAQVLGLESRPGGPVYFSDATAIYRLTTAG